MVREADFVKALQLERVIAPEGKTLPIEVANVNRPGLQLAGYWDFFGYERPQLLGKVEMTYLSMLDDATRRERLAKFFSYDLPCIIICRGLPCFDEMLVLAAARKIPIYRSLKETTRCEMEVITFLSDALAPRETRHGVLVDVYGSGLFITGNSGVGKSEAALELVKRGHRLVADDVVEIRRVSDVRLVGQAPELVRHFMEIRGVGIIDVATMYGVGAIIRSKSIDFEVHLELWKEGQEYDRLGLTDQYTQIMGVNIPRLLLPIHPGRNIAAVLEVAASNFRLKQMGYNAAEVLTQRHMQRAMREDNDEA
ncbi:MAG: HPr(Ser) kinase/phosphatase [Eubacteriales bacterium]|nr:HPr(Ser) kinase/phosphatase [Eubacteriales bacterium]